MGSLLGGPGGAVLMSSFLSVLRTPHIGLFLASSSIGARHVQMSFGLLTMKWWPFPSSTSGKGSFPGRSRCLAIDPAKRDVQAVSDPSSHTLIGEQRAEQKAEGRLGCPWGGVKDGGGAGVANVADRCQRMATDAAPARTSCCMRGVLRLDRTDS